MPKGIVYLVGAGPGDPGLLTMRGHECLGKASVVIYDRLVNPALLSHAKGAELIDVGKQSGHHPVPQEQINALLIEKARLGLTVVRLKGGDPFVFGRGGEEALALAEAAIPFEVVPGVTSAIAAPAYAGIPVTQRGLSTSVAIITGQRSEIAEESRRTNLETYPINADTLIFLMGVENLPRIVASLLNQGRPADTPVAVIEQGSTPHQQVVSGSLADIVERAACIRAPAVTIVGEVVRLREKLCWFDQPQTRPLFGLRVLNTRPQISLYPASGGDDFSANLSALGADVLNLPAIQVLPSVDPTGLERAINALRDCSASEFPPWDWILFTSANAVAAFCERFYVLGCDARLLAGVRLGAVGKATAQALAAYRMQADFVPSRFSGLDWVADAGDLQGQRLLLPRSEIAQPDLVEALQRRGAHVDVITAYTIQTPALDPDQPFPPALQALLDGEVDVVVFFSPSAVRGLLEILDQAGAKRPQGCFTPTITVACVGETTAEAAREQGLRVDLVAREHTLEGMLEALVIWRALS
jgi:uroporphyrinogen III methyltransferase/synthase